MALSEQLTAVALQELLTDPALATEWILAPSRSTISLQNRSMWGLVRVNGVFRQVTGDASVSPAGQVTGAVTVVAASIDTENAKRDKHLRSSDFFEPVTIRTSPSPARASGRQVRASQSPASSASVSAPGP